MKQNLNILMRKSYVIHIICWGIVIIFPLCFIEHTGNWTQDLGHYLRMSGVQVSFLLPFYINYFLLIPHNLFNGKIKSFFAINVLVVIAAFLLMEGWMELFNVLLPDMNAHYGHRPPKWPMHFQYFLSA